VNSPIGRSVYPTDFEAKLMSRKINSLALPFPTDFIVENSRRLSFSSTRLGLREAG